MWGRGGENIAVEELDTMGFLPWASVISSRNKLSSFSLPILNFVFISKKPKNEVTFSFLPQWMAVFTEQLALVCWLSVVT